MPARYCLCSDTTREDTLLKLCNRNGPAAVIGVFNAQSGTASAAPASAADAASPVELRGAAGPRDLPQLGGTRFACYAHNRQTLELLAADAQKPISLGPRGFELLSLVPMEQGFAPIGLADKLNSAGAIASVAWSEGPACELRIRDQGEFLAWCERRPAAVEVDQQVLDFAYHAEARSLRVTLTTPGPQTLRVRW